MMRALLLIAAASVATTAEPSILTNEGHVFIKSHGVEKNVTDLLEETVANRLFAAQAQKTKQVEKRAEDDIKATIEQLKGAQDQGAKVMADGFAELGAAVVNLSATLHTKLDDFKEASAAAAQGVADPLLSKKIYWLATDKVALPMNEAPVLVNVIGVGFEAFYNPLAPPFFVCTYQTKGQSNFTSRGTVVAGEKHSVYYTIQCASPGNVGKKAAYTLSVVYMDAKGAKGIPFQGEKGRDGVEFDMVWTGATFNQGDLTWVMDVEGLDVKTKYTCTFTDAANKNYKKVNDAAFVNDNKYKLSCGKQPSGFKVKGTVSSVVVAIAKSGTTEQVRYTGQGTPQLEFDVCTNGKQDGSETDVDCGGLCSTKCGAKKKCKVNDDCAGPKCNDKQKICGGGAGTSQSDFGESCRQILKDYKQKKNGVYWIIGVGASALEDPFKVYCWNADRQGGGWMLGMVTWHNPGIFNRFGTGSFNYDQVGNPSKLLGIKTMPFKMTDRHIQAVIGQKPGEASKFDVMGDQAGYHPHYSGGNYEYTVMSNYNQAWKFKLWDPIPESKTEATLTSYVIPSFDGKNPRGDGKENWKGQPICGQRKKRAGIWCQKTRKGTPQQAPRAGRGCRVNSGHNRWHGDMHWYMMDGNTDTYQFVCNGPQHSSGVHMNHRWWFRSAAGIEE